MLQIQYEDSIYSQVLGLSPSLVYDISKVRTLQYRLEDAPRAEALKVVRRISDAVDHPFLKDEAWRLYEESLPAEGGGVAGYVLPPGKGTDIIRKIIDPFKGNLVLVDFWSTGCGPCIANIRFSKDQRKKYEEAGTLTYVFITDEGGSPRSAYDEFVREQELTHTFRLTRDEWNYLEQLFQFSAIPRYVLFDREGRVLDGNFKGHALDYELGKYQ